MNTAIAVVDAARILAVFLLTARVSSHQRTSRWFMTDLVRGRSAGERYGERALNVRGQSSGLERRAQRVVLEQTHHCTEVHITKK